MSMDFKERQWTRKTPKALSALGFWSFVDFLDYQMVEAAGVEPASANAPLSYLHA